jgi:hypothetical protein
VLTRNPKLPLATDLKHCQLFVLAILLAGTSACGGGSNNSNDTPVAANPAPPAASAFVFRIRGDANGAEDFVALTSDPALIELARSELALPSEQRGLHLHGQLAAGNESYNRNWKWHLVPDQWHLVEISAEICDLSPSVVDQSVDYWIETVGAFCPWHSFVQAELPAA